MSVVILSMSDISWSDKRKVSDTVKVIVQIHGLCYWTQLKMAHFTQNIFCRLCLSLQCIEPRPSCLWSSMQATGWKIRRQSITRQPAPRPTASSTHVHLPTSTAIIVGPLHPSTREASVHKLLFDFMRGFGFIIMEVIRSKRKEMERRWMNGWIDG